MSQNQNDTAGVPRAAEELLRSVRGDHSPTPADRERVRRALTQRLADSGDTAPDLGAPPSAAALSPLAKLGIALLVVAGATFGISQSKSTTNGAEPTQKSAPAYNQPPPQVATVSAEAEQPKALPAETAPSTRSPSTRPKPRQRDSAQPRSSQPFNQRELSALSGSPVPTRDDSNQSASLEGPTLSVAEPASTTARAEPKNEQNATPAEPKNEQNAAKPRPNHGETITAVATRAPAKTAPPSAAVDEASDSARAELKFVTRIQKALQEGEPKQALALSKEHARRWPQGTFVEEREGLRTIAACQTHSPQAASEAHNFSATYPRSPMLANVLSTCARSKTPENAQPVDNAQRGLGSALPTRR